LKTFEGRKAHKHEVLAHIEQHFPLTEADRELEGEKNLPVWVGRVAWEASVMRRDGLLLRRKRGVWELVSKFETIPPAQSA
jgi:Mrr N-terminal domain